jgi:hypothetical protein
MQEYIKLHKFILSFSNRVQNFTINKIHLIDQAMSYAFTMLHVAQGLINQVKCIDIIGTVSNPWGFSSLVMEKPFVSCQG